MTIGPSEQKHLFTHNHTIITISEIEYTDEIFDKILSQYILTHPNIKTGIIFDTLELHNQFQTYTASIQIKTNLEVCTKDLINLDETDLLDKINLFHFKSSNHAGIEKTYQTLKKDFYYPNLKNYITKLINNCNTCAISKVDRQPLKLPFELTQTPNKPRQSFYMDIWFSGNDKKFLTCIDKFSKFAAIEPIETREWKSLLNASIRIFHYLGSPKHVTFDNEGGLKSLQFLTFLTEKNIAYHTTTSNRHTGNSDIERLHGTLNEQIIVLRNSEKANERTYYTDFEYEALFYYNNTLHLTTQSKPSDLHFSSNPQTFQDTYELTLNKKKKMIDKLNKNRTDKDVNPTLLKIVPGPKNKKNKYKKIKGQLISKTKIMNPATKIISHKDQFKRKKKFEQEFNEEVSPLRDPPDTISNTIPNIGNP